MKVNLRKINRPADHAACWCGSGKAYAECHKAFDDHLDGLKRAGYKVPNRKLIKTPAQIEGCREAGRINALVLDAVAEMIRPGITTQDIDDAVAAKTRELGGIAATLGFEGYPASVCTSVNNVVCHGIPSKKVVLKEGDIVNVDCTTIYNGYYGDASRMFCIGEVSPEAKKLVDVTKEAVELALKHLKPWSHIGDIGYYINYHARKNGYHVVREIGGHGVGLQMHEDPYVCHIGQLNKGMVLAPGMIFTIEPMINEGTGAFYQDEHDGWTIYTADGSLSAQWEYEILMTETGYEILSK
jgi:methionyl aminopeptidase